MNRNSWERNRHDGDDRRRGWYHSDGSSQSAPMPQEPMRQGWLGHQDHYRPHNPPDQMTPHHYHANQPVPSPMPTPPVPAKKPEKSLNKRALGLTAAVMGVGLVISAGITTVIESFSQEHQIEQLNLVGMTEQEAVDALTERDDSADIETVFADESIEGSDYDPEFSYVVSAYDVDGDQVELELSYHAADEILSQDDWLGMSLPELQRELTSYSQGIDYIVYTDTNGNVYVESNWSVADVGLDDDERVVFVVSNHFFNDAQETAEDAVDGISDALGSNDESTDSTD